MFKKNLNSNNNLVKKLFFVLTFVMALGNMNIGTAFAAATLTTSSVSVNAGKSTSFSIDISCDTAETGAKIILENTKIFPTGKTVTADLAAGSKSVSVGVDLTAITSSITETINVTIKKSNDDPLGSGTFTLSTVAAEQQVVYVDNPTSNTNTPDTSTPNNNASTIESVPTLVLQSPTSVVSLKAGNSTVVTITLKNIGTSVARNIYPTGKSSGTLGVVVKDPGMVPNATINGTTQFKVEISAGKDMDNGAQTASIGFNYMGADKKQYTGEASISLNVINEEKSQKAPNLILKDITINNKNIIPDDTFTISAVVENTSTSAANNVQVTVGGIDSEGINLTNASNNAYFENFSANSTQTITFELSTHKKMKQGSYPLTLDLKYKDSQNQDYTNGYSYYVGVGSKTAATSSDTKALLEIYDITAPTATFDTGQTVTIPMKIRNNGVLTAKNVKIVAEANESDKEAIVPKSANTQQILTLAPGESKDLSFAFAPTASSKTQNYSVGFTVEYENGLLNDEDDTKEKDTFSQYAGINVVNTKADALKAKEDADKEKESETEADKDKNKPKIIVSSFDVEPVLVMAGQEFDLNMTFKNTHPDKTVKNIKATLTVPANTSSTGTTSAGENVFTPVNASNTFYIDAIGSKASVDQYIRLYCVPDATPKNYILLVNFEYEDGEGVAHTEKEEIGINVRQIAKLELGEANIPSEAMANEPIYLDMNFQNTGKVSLNNLKIKMVGEGFNVAGTEIVYGNFAEGSYEYYSTSFTPIAEGQQTVKIVVTYDESSGERVEKEFPYEINIMPGMNPEGDGAMMQPSEIDEKTGMPIFTDAEGNKTTMDKDGNIIPYKESAGGILGFITSNILWIGIGAAVVVIVVVIIVVVVIKKRKKGFDDFNE